MSTYTGKRVTHSYTQHIDGPVEAVFPLICPVREAEWLEGFEYEMVYSESGLAEEGCVFTTRHLGGPEVVWSITRHDPKAGVVQFCRVTPGVTVDLLRVEMEPDGEGKSLCHIRYDFTSFSAQGEHYLAHHQTEADFMDMVTWWEKSVNHYLATGEMLRGHPGH